MRHTRRCLGWTINARSVLGADRSYMMRWQTCASCGAWLSLGQSDESAVAVEVRAAEIAEDHPVTCDHIDDGNDCPECGWNDYSLDIDIDGTERDGYFAGWLARAIYDHDRDQMALARAAVAAMTDEEIERAGGMPRGSSWGMPVAEEPGR